MSTESANSIQFDNDIQGVRKKTELWVDQKQRFNLYIFLFSFMIAFAIKFDVKSD